MTRSGLLSNPSGERIWKFSPEPGCFRNPGIIYYPVIERERSSQRESHANASGKVKFEYLLPGKYKIKIIKDRNHNGKWDTGNYRLKLQPEEVVYFPKEIEIRANWDVEENWALSPAK